MPDRGPGPFEHADGAGQVPLAEGEHGRAPVGNEADWALTAASAIRSPSSPMALPSAKCPELGQDAPGRAGTGSRQAVLDLPKARGACPSRTTTFRLRQSIARSIVAHGHGRPAPDERIRQHLQDALAAGRGEREGRWPAAMARRGRPSSGKWPMRASTCPSRGRSSRARARASASRR